MKAVIHADLSHEYVLSILNYNKDNGVFTWKYRNDAPKNWNSRRANNIAGSEFRPRNRNIIYWQIRIGKKLILAHRLAWFVITGKWPDNQIDHIDGDGLNNRIDNLRDVTNKENCKNMPRMRKNTSGFTGVFWNSNVGKWQAKINRDGKAFHGGWFSSFSEACKSRKELENIHGFHKNHGRQ